VIADTPLAVVVRGGFVESRHHGAYAIVGPGGAVIRSGGDVERLVYPRSAIKALQCLAVIESGAADRFGFSAAEIALACASHGGEPDHVETARAMLAKLGLDADALECGAHWPSDPAAARELARRGDTPGALHNNCSGKHAGMLAVALALGAPYRGYVEPGHPVQQRIAAILGALTGSDLALAPRGVDGCSVPTWALPLHGLARAFHRFVTGEAMPPVHAAAAQRILAAVRAHPFMVAGSKRFCTDLMRIVPRAFVKTGAEGVFCAAVPHAGLGIALKCSDGASRAAETAIAGLLAGLDVWTEAERQQLIGFARVTIRNWRNRETGEIQALV
jgi:L-asparaginase II